MKKLIILLFLFVNLLQANAQSSQLFEQLDSVLDHRKAILNEKQKRIASLKTWARRERDAGRKLRLYEDIYQEYYVFQFDSAMAYTNRSLKLAKKVGNKFYYQQSLINKAELLGIGSLYNESLQCIQKVDTTNLTPKLKFSYYIALYRIYNYQTEYAKGSEYESTYMKTAGKYLEKILPYLDPQDASYEYYCGEYINNVKDNHAEAKKHYLNAMKILPEDSRFYAMSCYVLALYSLEQGNKNDYIKYLVKAAISDTKACTMENSALRDIALYLFKSSNDIERAQHYINVALNDAQWYHNRLRIVQVSEYMPMIIEKYQNIINERIRRQHILLLALLTALVISLGGIAFIIRQNRMFKRGRQKLTIANNQLSQLNDRQKDFNRQLSVLNEKLVDTNRKREGLAKVYIELCAKYINKLARYKTLVKRKIQAHQEKELLTHISSTKLSEEEAASFLSRFDKAFLDLYPNFIEEFNKLLRPDSQITVADSNALTPELRIYALVRLGVKESNEIAGLLFLSPQTIYNYRTSVRNRAINRDTFDDDVRHLSQTH